MGLVTTWGAFLSELLLAMVSTSATLYGGHIYRSDADQRAVTWDHVAHDCAGDNPNKYSFSEIDG
ncbi:hypothetical protein GCM10007391_17240 [Alteromonas halophila]|uniref:Uncharacterized protein n=1 Tax=Alteromonas halophila TaxID=516698 RepID=A0A918MZ65_9ALTE|nr:hypothetical protein GCM10007391_17240 [Alteromonas halophila]